MFGLKNFRIQSAMHAPSHGLTKAMEIVGVRGVFGGRPWHVAADDGGTLGRAKLLCPVVDDVVVVQPLQGIRQGQASDTDQHLKRKG
jgi:hypothetical protein